jgi:hypothetical protein
VAAIGRVLGKKLFGIVQDTTAVYKELPLPDSSLIANCY